MYTAYWQAAEHAYRHSGEWDYKSLFNALDATFLLAARSEKQSINELPPFNASAAPVLSPTDLLMAGAANARRRFADNREFFHDLAIVEAKRIDALLSTVAPDAASRPVSADCLAALTDDYRNILRRYGTTNDHDSIINHMVFLLDLLSNNDKTQDIADALRKLIAACKR